MRPGRLGMGRLAAAAVLAFAALGGRVAGASEDAAPPTPASLAPQEDPASFGADLAALVVAHPGKSGLYLLEKGEESLLARAFLADNAQESIDVQYFIWSSDNIGTLAAEALLRAAERGVRVRVLVDDLLMDAPGEVLLALAAHPHAEIRIYNPVHNVGTPLYERLFNVFWSFKNANQRMHDKTFLVDGRAAITGGRNMADEYYDYDHAYNFRDRDLLALGPVAQKMEESFGRFWESPLSVPVAELLPGEMASLQQEEKKIAAIYEALHDYALNPENFAPEVRAALSDLPSRFPALTQTLVWEEAEFLSDDPGKNDARWSLSAGGRTTSRLAEVLGAAQKSVTIQTPYLVLPEGALGIFQELRARGVRVRISTNSLLSTDNLPAFSGYWKQRAELLDAGIEIYEFRPAPAIERELIDRYAELAKEAPLFAVHAKTLVVDGRVLFVGTFNLDPRSANLNTEVGVLVESEPLAREAEASIARDMLPENSWNAAEDPDANAPLWRRLRLQTWRVLPIDALL